MERYSGAPSGPGGRRRQPGGELETGVDRGCAACRRLCHIAGRDLRRPGQLVASTGISHDHRIVAPGPGGRKSRW